MNRAKGSLFEKQIEQFFKNFFEEMGFVVITVRRQKAGTQNGFDVKVTFLDDDDNERSLFFECKDYESALNWNDIFPKICELDGSNYEVDGFFALSPKVAISNINDNLVPSITQKFSFPIRLWDSNCTFLEQMLSLDSVIYKSIYKADCTIISDRDSHLRKFRNIFESVLTEKKLLKLTHIIEINSSDKKPNEGAEYVTNLDTKLNEVILEDDPDRKEYHQLRCDYKVYLESLNDINNSLRLKIMKWQDNLRLKAKRLTKKFQTTENYSPNNFFNDFFDAAEQELATFFSSEKLDGDREKLLHGVVFELAAECPLDWRRKKNETVTT